MTPAIYFATLWTLPATFTFNVAEGGKVTASGAFWCCALGLWSGLIIGLITEYYTSGSQPPV
jgi:Na+/H+-translocating membrane pyrophosphatase